MNAKLSFKEKVAWKMLVKNNSLEDYTTNIGKAIVDQISFHILFGNEKFLEEIILKALSDQNSLEYKIYKGIDNIDKTAKQKEWWKQLNNKMVSEYLSSNLYDADQLPKRFDVVEAFKYNIRDKIRNNELDQNSIDKISEMPAHAPKYLWLPLTFSILKEEGKEDLLSYAVEKQYAVFETKINSQNMPDEEKTMVLNAIKQNFTRYIRGIIEYEDLQYICADCYIQEGYSEVLSLARTGVWDMSCLTVSQIANINLKNTKQIFELAKNKYPDEEFTYSVNHAIYKMYIMFGKQRTMELIEGKYGDISLSQIEHWLDSVSVENYQITQKNAEPNYDKSQAALINFLFASGVNDVNANIKKILSGEISSDEISMIRLFNEWNRYYDFLGGKVTVPEIIKLMDKLEVFVSPNEKEVINTIKLAGLEHQDKIVDSYKRMQKRTESQIPKVKGIAGEYEYEILDMVDPIQMNVGYYTECCFTFGGASESSLIHACTNSDSRIFVIKKEGKVVAQSWIWRNGNTMCFDNIEVYGIVEQAGSKFWHVYENVANEILNISQKSESPDQKIQLVTIGKGFTKIDLKGKPLICDKPPLPRKDTLYTDARQQVILATSEDYEKPLEYEVEAKYQDERKKVIVIDPQQASQDSIDKLNVHIDKISYSVDSENFKECNSFEDYTFVMYGFDWFIGITVDGNIVKKEYSFDERSKEEISNALKIIKEKIRSGELDNSINDINLDDIVKDSDSYGKK